MGPLGAFRDGEEPLVAVTGPTPSGRRRSPSGGDGYGAGDRGPDDFKDYAMPLVELQRLLDWYLYG